MTETEEDEVEEKEKEEEEEDEEEEDPVCSWTNKLMQHVEVQACVCDFLHALQQTSDTDNTQIWGGRLEHTASVSCGVDALWITFNNLASLFT